MTKDDQIRVKNSMVKFYAETSRKSWTIIHAYALIEAIAPNTKISAVQKMVEKFIEEIVE